MGAISILQAVHTVVKHAMLAKALRRTPNDTLPHSTARPISTLPCGAVEATLHGIPPINQCVCSARTEEALTRKKPLRRIKVLTTLAYHNSSSLSLSCADLCPDGKHISFPGRRRETPRSAYHTYYLVLIVATYNHYSTTVPTTAEMQVAHGSFALPHESSSFGKVPANHGRCRFNQPQHISSAVVDLYYNKHK